MLLLQWTNGNHYDCIGDYYEYYSVCSNARVVFLTLHIRDKSLLLNQYIGFKSSGHLAGVKLYPPISLYRAWFIHTFLFTGKAMFIRKSNSNLWRVGRSFGGFSFGILVNVGGFGLENSNIRTAGDTIKEIFMRMVFFCDSGFSHITRSVCSFSTEE